MLKVSSAAGKRPWSHSLFEKTRINFCYSVIRKRVVLFYVEVYPATQTNEESKDNHCISVVWMVIFFLCRLAHMIWNQHSSTSRKCFIQITLKYRTVKLIWDNFQYSMVINLNRWVRPAFLTLISFCSRNFDKVKTALRFANCSRDLQLTLIWYLREFFARACNHFLSFT